MSKLRVYMLAKELGIENIDLVSVLQTQAHQSARPLARAIKYFKDIGVWHRTLIAIYTLDGSREPRANSYGDNGKGTVVLAGGSALATSSVT